MEKFNGMNVYVITPSMPNNPWLEECKASVSSQTVRCSHIVIEDLLKKGACRNHYEALQLIPASKDNIVIHLDGDDYFTSVNSVSIILEAYKDENIWATYGNYTSTGKSVCRPIPQNSFRDSIIFGGWGWSHPRTFRASLIPYLRESTMKDRRGNWFSSAPDVAIFCPILELSGKSRVKFIDRELVYYRIHSDNEHSESKLADQVRCALELARMPPYNELP
jgi:hypothetical protein